MFKSVNQHLLTFSNVYGGKLMKTSDSAASASMMQTQLGPQMIIGMAIFREYYSTFDLGSGPNDRTISFMAHDSHCNPTLGVQTSAARLGPRAPHIVDASKIRVREFPVTAGLVRI